MPFDLEKHLKDHAYIFIKLSNLDKNSIHFNFSFLDLQFLDKDVEKTMSSLLASLLLPTSYEVVNGNRKLVDGTPVKKTTNREINLQKDIQVMAIHLKGPEGEDTMPHIHFIADGSARFGKAFSLLKKHISVISEQFGLLPNFDEIAEHNPLSVKSLSKAVSQITWSWKKSTNAQLKQEIHTRGLDKSISLLESYCLKTKNLTYYIKSMEGLKTRLNRMKLDVIYKEHHIKDTYPIPLTKKDMSVIKLIKNKQFTQKAIKPYLKNPIFRDFIRHSAETSKPYIYDALKEQTSLLDSVHKNKLAVENYLKLTMKETPLRKSQLTPTDNEKLSRKNELRRIILEVCQNATNKKTFKTQLENAGYPDFELKKKQGKVLGCSYKELDSKRHVNFTDLGLHWGEIKQYFMDNNRKVDNGEDIPLPMLKKKPPTAQELTTAKKRTPTPDTVSIEHKVKKITDKKAKAKETSKLRRTYEKLIPDLKTEIIKFEDIISKLRAGISNLRNKIVSFGRRKKERNLSTEENKSSEITQLELDTTDAEEEQSRLAEKYLREEKMECQIDTESDNFKGEIKKATQLQSNLENGNYELNLHNNITEEIKREERAHEELRGKISQLELTSTLHISTEDNDTISPVIPIKP